MTTRRLMLTLTVGVALFACVAGLILEVRRAERAERTLEEIYQSALSETAEQMQALSLTLEKTLVTGDVSQNVKLLAQVSQLSEDVRRNLTFLPLSHEAMAPTLTFTNQLAEYAAVLLPVLVKEGELPGSDASQLETLLTDCYQLSSQLSLAQQDLKAQQLSLSSRDPVFSAKVSAEERPLESVGDKDNGMQYPTLIYDGAFSDARHKGTPKGLPEGQVTQAEALALARAFVGEVRVKSVREAPATSGALPAWGVTVQTEDLQLNVEITVQGGKVLWMMPEEASFNESLPQEVCQTRAEAFLTEKGFGEMALTHTQRYGDGLLLLNYAAVQDSIVLYPDLVKVQVRMDTGEVVGLEANNYWMNHVARHLASPELTAEEARAKLSSVLDVVGVRLCVIPYRDTERLCYEFTARRSDALYLIYLDATTAAQLDLLKIIDTDEGRLTAQGREILGERRFSERSASPPDPLSRRAVGVWCVRFCLVGSACEWGVSTIGWGMVTAADRAAATFAAFGGRCWGRGRFSERSASPPGPLSRRAVGVWRVRSCLVGSACEWGVSPIGWVMVTAADRAAATFAVRGTNPSARLRRAPPLSGEAVSRRLTEDNLSPSPQARLARPRRLCQPPWTQPTCKEPAPTSHGRASSKKRTSLFPSTLRERGVWGERRFS